MPSAAEPSAAESRPAEPTAAEPRDAESTAAESAAARLYAALAQELLQHYPRGPVVIAVTGPGALVGSAADALGDAVAATGRTVARASGHGEQSGAVGALRADVIAPFRADGGDVLLVDGPELLGSSLRGSWNASVWIEGGPAAPNPTRVRDTTHDDDSRAAASAVLNLADPDRPVRVYSDSC